MREKIKLGGTAGNPFERKTKTPEQALASLMRLCSRAEKSSGDALRLMRGWGLEQNDMQEVLGRLIKDRFIDDRRYAEAYTREKTNLNGWGVYKIKLNLRRKGVSPDIIEDVVSGLGGDAQKEKLRELLQRRKARTKAPDEYAMKAKLLRYGAGLGYGYEDVADAIEYVMNHDG